MLLFQIIFLYFWEFFPWFTRSLFMLGWFCRCFNLHGFPWGNIIWFRLNLNHRITTIFGLFKSILNPNISWTLSKVNFCFFINLMKLSESNIKLSFFIVLNKGAKIPSKSIEGSMLHIKNYDLNWFWMKILIRHCQNLMNRRFQEVFRWM